MLLIKFIFSKVAPPNYYRVLSTQSSAGFFGFFYSTTLVTIFIAAISTE